MNDKLLGLLGIARRGSNLAIGFEMCSEDRTFIYSFLHVDLHIAVSVIYLCDLLKDPAAVTALTALFHTDIFFRERIFYSDYQIICPNMNIDPDLSFIFRKISHRLHGIVHEIGKNAALMESGDSRKLTHKRIDG